MGNFTLKGSRIFKGKPIKKRLAEKLREYEESLKQIFVETKPEVEVIPKKTKKLAK